MGADNCQVSLSWMRVIQGYILLNRKIQNVLLSSCCGTGVFPDMLAFQSMFLYSKDRGRHKEWTAASEAILTGLELALAREEVFDYSNNYKNQLCHSCSSFEVAIPEGEAIYIDT